MIINIIRNTILPDEYNYLADGAERFEGQLKSPEPTDFIKAAALWKELAELAGEKEMANIFQAWAKADVDPADPGDALRRALLKGRQDTENLEKWWNKAESLFILTHPKSGFTAITADKKELAGKPLEIKYDDGRQANKKSIAGSGHAVRYQVPGNNWYLTQVKLYGSRYGYPRAPKEDFHIWLCDKDFKVIADFPQPYGRFKTGNPRWVNPKIYLIVSESVK